MESRLSWCISVPQPGSVWWVLQLAGSPSERGSHLTRTTPVAFAIRSACSSNSSRSAQTQGPLCGLSMANITNSSHMSVTRRSCPIPESRGRGARAMSRGRTGSPRQEKRPGARTLAVTMGTPRNGRSPVLNEDSLARVLTFGRTVNCI